MVCPPIADDGDDEEPEPMTPEQLEILRELAWAY